jgi:hypothetical protein
LVETVEMAGVVGMLGVDALVSARGARWPGGGLRRRWGDEFVGEADAAEEGFDVCRVVLQFGWCLGGDRRAGVLDEEGGEFGAVRDEFLAGGDAVFGVFRAVGGSVLRIKGGVLVHERNKNTD